MSKRNTKCKKNISNPLLIYIPCPPNITYFTILHCRHLNALRGGDMTFMWQRILCACINNLSLRVRVRTAFTTYNIVRPKLMPSGEGFDIELVSNITH